jgi:RES domain-containing protein
MSFIDLQVPFDDLVYAEGPDLDELDLHAIAWCPRPGRWNRAGRPTGYLAGDPGVLFAEVGGHLAGHDAPAPSVVWRVRLRLDRAIDLREAYACHRLGIAGPEGLVDVRRCRRLAAELRASGDADGLIVPSVAFAAERGRWSVVVFPERLSVSLDRHLRAVGRLHMGRLGSLTSRMPETATVRTTRPAPALPAGRGVPAHLMPRRPSSIGGFGAMRGDVGP